MTSPLFRGSRASIFFVGIAVALMALATGVDGARVLGSLMLGDAGASRHVPGNYWRF